MSQTTSAAFSADAAGTPDPTLWNEDPNPTSPAVHTRIATNYAVLWVSMVVSVPTYVLASGLMSKGINRQQAVLTVFLGNLIVLASMVLVEHVGTKYGIPFSVPVWASFGVRGAQSSAIPWAIAACGWFGIQTWLDSQAIYTIPDATTDNMLVGGNILGLGVNPGQGPCFLLFRALHIWLTAKGFEPIKCFQALATPLLILAALGLIWWAYISAGGPDPMLSAPSAFTAGDKCAGELRGFFWLPFTAMVSYWAMLVLNIPNFTRFACSQHDQLVGQAVGLPLPMGLPALVAVLVTPSTVVIYGQAIWDPITLTGKMTGPSVIVILLVLVTVTLMTNIATNVVLPAYDSSDLAPHRISPRAGNYITADAGLVIMPREILGTTKGYIFTWPAGCGALLGPAAGVMMADHFLARRVVPKTGELPRVGSPYGCGNDRNGRTIAALVIGVLPSLPGFFKQTGFVANVPGVSEAPYTYAWLVGLVISAVAYAILTHGRR